MNKEQKKLIDCIFKLKKRKEAIKFYSNNSDHIEMLESSNNELAYNALAYITNLMTPEDYDDDICD